MDNLRLINTNILNTEFSKDLIDKYYDDIKAPIRKNPKNLKEYLEDFDCIILQNIQKCITLNIMKNMN